MRLFFVRMGGARPLQYGKIYSTIQVSWDEWGQMVLGLAPMGLIQIQSGPVRPSPGRGTGHSLKTGYNWLWCPILTSSTWCCSVY